MTPDDSECSRSVTILSAGAQKIGIELSADTCVRFSTYCRLLRAENQRVNLTAVRDAPGIMTTLYLDSLTILVALRQHVPGLVLDSPHVVDVGTGAGVPGVPLKIALPEWRLTLVESVGKKARFLESLVQELDLSETRVINARAEAVGHDAVLRDSADLCVARAVASLPTVIELCAPFTRTGGIMAFPRSGQVAAQIEEARRAAQKLRAQFLAAYPVPGELGLGAERAVVLYRKMESTPPGYPRRVGLARARPLAHADLARSRTDVVSVCQRPADRESRTIGRSLLLHPLARDAAGR